jgi:hypothetical protein
MEINEELIPILYNSCYGGFMITEKALNEYNKRRLLIDINFKNITSCFLIERNDSILNEIYREFDAKDFNVKYSFIKTHYIKKEYEKYYNINEYDGLESVGINLNQYKLDKIKEIIYNINLSNDIKIEKINDLINLQDN